MRRKTRSLSVPVSPEVAAFAVVMEGRLSMEGYDQVERWDTISVERLVRQIEVKGKRLAAAEPTDATGIFNKAVVIATLAMMVADKAMQARRAQVGPEAFEAEAEASLARRNRPT